MDLVLVTPEEYRAVLVESGDRETPQLVSIAILELRMKLNRIAELELMLSDDAPAERRQELKSQGQRPMLKLVKERRGSRAGCAESIRGLPVALLPRCATSCRNAALLIEKVHRHRRCDCAFLRIRYTNPDQPVLPDTRLSHHSKPQIGSDD